ncbi:MAG: hypothetical protein HYS13_12370 [Planctomycetia bacterium]|nr:hypothetical protein [Planctomycetia bacterium]
MRHQAFGRLLVLCAAGTLSLYALWGGNLQSAPPAAKSPPKQAAPAGFPEFDAVKQAVEEHFAGIKGHEATDIISRSQAEGALDAVASLGWKVPDREEIVSQVPKDDEFLVKQLRTQKGTKFMRQIAKQAGGYDKVDRLSQLPDGKSIVSRLIAGPDGHKLVDYLAGASGGKEMEKMLARTPRGKNFDKPTGRIYTMDQLIDRLATSYQAATQR